MNLLKLQEKISNAPELDFGGLFSESIELFKKVWVQGLLLLVFAVIMILPLVIILYAPIIAMAVASESGGFDPESDPLVAGGFSVGMIIGMLFFIIAIAVVSTALVAGFYHVCKAADQGKEVSTNMLFKFLKKEYVGKLLQLGLIVMVIAIVAALLCVLPIFYVMVPLSFIAPLFAFNSELSPNELVKAAFALGNKKWLLMFGLLIVISLGINIISYVTCGIGAIVLGCFQYLPVFLVYKKIIGFEDGDEIDQIGASEQ